MSRPDLPLDDGELLTLHGLRLLGFAPATRLAERVGMAVHAIEAELAALASGGHVIERTGARSGWTLTAAGRSRGESLLAAELDRAGVREAVTACHAWFVPINRALLETCTRWQVKDLAERVLNDHQDPAYDAEVLDRLDGIDAQIQPICAELGRCLDRFAGYGPRLAVALERVRDGDHDWFTKPLIESYHTVWFELHEDLLATLGLDRSTESARNESASGAKERTAHRPVVG